MAYVESTDLVRGEDMMLYVKENTGTEAVPVWVDTPVAYATSNSLSYSLDTIDTSNKMSGDWKSALPGQIGWTISTDALISATDGHMSYNTLEDLMIARNSITVKFGKVGSAFALDVSKIVRSGEAFITSLELNTERGGICTSSITLQGNGKLTAAIPI
ncbi:MAG: phage tail tube protein [Paludibacteraceae bacterium]